MVQTGNFSGQIFKPGLEAGKGASGDGIIYLAPFHSLEDKVPEDVKVKLEELKQGIINGTTRHLKDTDIGNSEGSNV